MRGTRFNWYSRTIPVHMADARLSRTAVSRDEPIEDWPYLDQGTLLTSRSRKVCMTCHWFRHHPGLNCIPVLTCQLHQGLLIHGEHLTRRCQGSTEDQLRHRGWCPDLA